MTYAAFGRKWRKPQFLHSWQNNSPSSRPTHTHPPCSTSSRPRVLELTYTAWDLQPFARDLDYQGAPFVWDEDRRFLMRCELDALYFHLYGIERDDVDYIMETFPIVKKRMRRLTASTARSASFWRCSIVWRTCRRCGCPRPKTGRAW